MSCIRKAFTLVVTADCFLNVCQGFVKVWAMEFVFIAEDMVTGNSTPGLVYLLKG